MVTLVCTRYDEALAKAREIWDAECEAVKCPVPAKDRGPEWTQMRYPPFAHADTKAIAVIVTDTKLLTPADAAKVVTVPPADEAKWQPAWDATTVGVPKP
jgi:hypothetical protein